MMVAFPDGLLDTQTWLFYCTGLDGLWYVHTVFDSGDGWHVYDEPLNIVGFLSPVAAKCWAGETFETEENA